MSDNMNDKIFEFAYELALRDATIRTAYGGDKDKLRENKNAKIMVKDYINGIIKAEPIEFDAVAENVEESFKNYVKPKKDDEKSVTFTFGNTQKLINMTAKYMYIATYNNKELRKNFKCCHCPLDSKMRDVVRKELKKISEGGALNEEQKNTALNHMKELRKYKFGDCAWSRITKDNKGVYEEFQNAVKFIADKDGIYPIEFDYKNWSPSEEKKEDIQ